MRPLLALVLVPMLLAGCAAPTDDSGDAPTPGGPSIELTQAEPPTYALSVVGFGDGSFVVHLENGGETAIDVAPDSFVLVDGHGDRWPAAAANTTDALAPGRIQPGESATGRVEFGFVGLPTPARLTYEEGEASATWLLQVSGFEVALAAGDDTSFGEAIELPSNGTITYRVSEAEGDVAFCVIEDAAHETWLSGRAPAGYGCRQDLPGQGEATVLVPSGAYNVGMACRGDTEPCRFRLTVVASW